MEETHPQLRQAQEFLDKAVSLEDVAVSMHVDGRPIISRSANKPMRMMSVQKLIPCLAYAREVAVNPALAQEEIPLSAIPEPAFFDGGAHEAWKATLGSAETVTFQQVAEGMMRQSSNGCTEYVINRFGPEKLNAVMKDYAIELPSFTGGFTADRARVPGRAKDITMLLEGVATQEPQAVHDIFASVTPLQLNATTGTTAQGFWKGGSGIHPMEDTFKHDLNLAQHTRSSDGHCVTATVFTNNTNAADNQFLEDRMLAFMCETAGNPAFRAQCAKAMRPIEATDISAVAKDAKSLGL